jgi:CHAD domain-containing protein
MKLHWKDSLTLKENLRAKLPRLAKAFFQAGRKAAETKRSWKQLHKFRLAAKEFRYTLELFRPVYGKELEERLDSLRKVQRHLGEMNDCVAGVKLLKQMEGPANVIERLKRQRHLRLSEFHRYWRKFDADGEEDSWVNYLRSL